MIKKILIITVMILLSFSVFAAELTERERNDIKEFIEIIGDDKDRFEILLIFLDAKGYNLIEEKEITDKIENNAIQFQILLMPYDGIKGINKQKIDKEILKKIEARKLLELGKKPIDIGGFWYVFVILISLIIIIYVLELYRKEKIKKVMRKKKKK